MARADDNIYEGDTVRVRWTLQERETGDPILDAILTCRFEGPDFLIEDQLANQIGGGVYEASVNVERKGVYYCSVTAESENGERKSDEIRFVVKDLKGNY